MSCNHATLAVEIPPDHRGFPTVSPLRTNHIPGCTTALDQRIALRYAMTGMTDVETKSYRAHHLKLAGRADTLFSDDAITLDPPGLPRPAPGGDNLAIQALVAAFASNKAIVDESSARAAVTEVTTE